MKKKIPNIPKSPPPDQTLPMPPCQPPEKSDFEKFADAINELKKTCETQAKKIIEAINNSNNHFHGLGPK